MIKTGIQGRFGSRSMGLKLIVVCILALLMTIPTIFVEGLVQERTQREADVVREIGGHVGGQQTFLGPTLGIPYTIPARAPSQADEHGIYLVFPVRGTARIRTTTRERHRSLFRVPVFEADARMDAAFDLGGVPAAAPEGAELDWSRAEIVVGVSDARGALEDGSLTIAGRELTLVPAGIAQFLSLDQNSRLVLLGASAGAAAASGARFEVSSELRFSGAQRVAMIAYGKTTRLAVEGDWPNPGFDGDLLPLNHTITPAGFHAEWSVPFIARGVRAEGSSESMAGLDASSLGVSFVEVADPYQSVTRSIKYRLLFLGLIFLSYFLFEVGTGRRVHPAQYVLVGVAQSIFYLLLLSLAERIGFDYGFLAAGAATVLLLSLNAVWLFRSYLQGLKALFAFSLLYAVIYLLLRLEDNALLVGAITSFLAVAAAMYLTRRIDWYGSLSPRGEAEPAPEAAGGAR